MPDQMKTDKSYERCSFWDCGDIFSPFKCDHILKPGEKGICKPRKSPCALEEGEPCGMYMEKP